MDTATAVSIPVLGQVVAVTSEHPGFAYFRNDVPGEEFSFVRPYDAKIQKLPEYRHSVIRYRNLDKPGTVQKAAQMVTVPSIKFSDDLAIVLTKAEATVFLGLIEDAEDSIIRTLIEAGASKVNWSALGWTKAVEFLTAERVSQRLTKEQIDAWFLIAGKEFCDKRAAQICDAKGITDVAEIAKQKAGTLTAYKDNIVKLAAPVPNLGQQTATALSNMLLTANLDDDMAKVLKAKLHAILHPQIVENGDL